MKRGVTHNTFLQYPGFHGRMDGYETKLVRNHKSRDRCGGILVIPVDIVSEDDEPRILANYGW